MKRPFIKKQKRKKHGTTFWDSEYAGGGEHLALSSDESEDLAKFTRWIRRQKDEIGLLKQANVLDLGCGNGRNLVFLAREFYTKGTGYDISTAAIAEAKRASTELPIEYTARSIAGDIDLPDESQDLVLDMMTSHFLNNAEREALRGEIYRVLKPGGWLFMKTFLRNEDLHTERLLREFGTDEPGTYVHPVIGVPEHTYYEDELLEFLDEKFIIHKVYRSHQHRSHGKARKRRTVSVYVQKDPYI